MGVAFGVLCIWLGAALIWVATHGVTATTPWGMWEELMDGLRDG